MTGKRCGFAVIALVFSWGLHHVAGQGRFVPGRVVFNSARDGNNGIYVMDWDGSRPLRITNDPASDVDPDMSTNGRDIVFTSSRTGDNDIYIVGATGGTPVNLTHNSGRQIYFMSWSSLSVEWSI